MSDTSQRRHLSPADTTMDPPPPAAEPTLVLGARGARGATAVEYGLIVALIAAVILVGVTALGLGAVDLFEDTNTEMTDAGL